MAVKLIIVLLLAATKAVSGIVTRAESAGAKVFDGSAQHLEPTKDNNWKGMKVLLYVTTAASEQHISFLRCYPEFLAAQSKLSAMTDILLHVSEANGLENGTQESRERFEQLLDAWPARRWKKVIIGPNPGKQGGAMKVIDDALTNGWFRGYDWVIRINPDVLIYDASRLISLMEEEHNWGIFATCGISPKWGGVLTNTDFFAVRPERVPVNTFSEWKWYADTGRIAEVQATKAFQHIYDSGNFAYLKKKSHNEKCHLQDGGVWHAFREPYCGKSVKKLITNTRLSSAANSWQEAWRNRSAVQF